MALDAIFDPNTPTGWCPRCKRRLKRIIWRDEHRVKTWLRCLRVECDPCRLMELEFCNVPIKPPGVAWAYQADSAE
jgi:hypothetical protein